MSEPELPPLHLKVVLQPHLNIAYDGELTTCQDTFALARWLEGHLWYPHTRLSIPWVPTWNCQIKEGKNGTSSYA